MHIYGKEKQKKKKMSSPPLHDKKTRDLQDMLRNQNDKIKRNQERSTHMLQIPKAGVQTPGQVPLEMGCIYFSLKNHTSLAQVSHIPDNSIEVHSKKRFIFSSIILQTDPIVP